jgi:excisionase family DNA binding protein
MTTISIFQDQSERTSEPPRSVPQVYTTKEAARLLGVSHRTLEDWRTRGAGPRFIMLGRLVRYRATDLERFVNRNDFGNTAEAQAA